MRKAFSISMVKNEEDIIESFVRYNSSFLDGMVVVDNSSSDDTFFILQQLQNEGLPLYLSKYNETNFLQEQKMNQMLYNTIHQFNPDIIIPLDCDEFLVANNEKNPREILENLDLNKVYLIRWRTYIPCVEDNKEHRFIPCKMQQARAECYETFSKVLLSSVVTLQSSLTLQSGQHDVSSSNKIERIHLDELRIAHFPIRSINQLKSKLLVGWVNTLARYNRKEGESVHWEYWFNKIIYDQDITHKDLVNIAKRYDCPSASLEIQTITLPINLSFSSNCNLRYTKRSPVDYTKNLISNSCQLAQDYVELKKNTIKALYEIRKLTNILSQKNMVDEAFVCNEIIPLFDPDPNPDPTQLYIKANLLLRLNKNEDAIIEIEKFLSVADPIKHKSLIENANIALINLQKILVECHV